MNFDFCYNNSWFFVVVKLQSIFLIRPEWLLPLNHLFIKCPFHSHKPESTSKGNIIHRTEQALRKEYSLISKLFKLFSLVLKVCDNLIFKENLKKSARRNWIITGMGFYPPVLLCLLQEICKILQSWVCWELRAADVVHGIIWIFRTAALRILFWEKFIFISASSINNPLISTPSQLYLIH